MRTKEIYEEIMIIAVLFVLGRINVALGVFLIRPVNFNTSLGQTVQFNCSVSEQVDRLYWLINGFEDYERPNWNRQIATETEQNRITSLTIVALSINDNIQIICVAEDNGAKMRTDPVILRVQGILGVPVDLTAYSVSNSIQLSWSAPWTLNLTDIEPDIQHYVVSVYNTHTGHNTSVVVNTTEHIHTPSESEWGSDSICEEIEFRVRAVNVVGKGNQSNAIHASYHRAPVITQSQVPTSNEVSTTYNCTAQCTDGIIWNIIDPQFNQQLLQQRVLLLGSGSQQCAHGSDMEDTFTEVFEVPNYPELNGTLIQCIAIQLCIPTDGEICKPVVCSSNHDVIHINVMYTPATHVYTQSVEIDPNSSTTITKAEQLINKEMGSATLLVFSNTPLSLPPYIYIIGGTGGTLVVFLLATVIVLMAIIVTVLWKRKKTSKSSANSSFEGIYDLPNMKTRGNFCESSDDHNSAYSIPLPTDPCPAYATIEQKPTESV